MSGYDAIISLVNDISVDVSPFFPINSESRRLTLLFDVSGNYAIFLIAIWYGAYGIHVDHRALLGRLIASIFPHGLIK